MRLVIATVDSVLLDQAVDKVAAEGVDGSFCLLPQHTDFVSALAPGILELEAGGKTHYAAVDIGLLTKHGDAVRVACRRAVLGDELGELRALVQARYSLLDEHERQARKAAARLEAGFMRRYLEWRKAEHG